MPAALLLLLATATAARLGDLARRDHGDVFTILGDACDTRQCAEHGAGAHTSSVLATDSCTCACPQRAPLFREDRELCVDDLPECALATFGTGVGVQKIPFVFLPLKAQIIHPSREIIFQDVKTPICAVSGAQFLTRKGFVDLRNTVDADVPFNLFRDEGRTFLQWTGEEEMRTRMKGRVMVVRLLCRDVAETPSSPQDLRGVFTPCVAFRVQGSPPRLPNNVAEVQFTPNAQTAETPATSGLSITEYVAIGISSVLLGLIYVASVFLYLHIRKRRKTASDEGSTRRLKGLKKKDGTAITERDIIRITNDRIPTLVNVMDGDDNIVKKNPLLAIRGQFHEIKNNFTSDSGSNLSDSEEFGEISPHINDIFNKQITSALVHPHETEFKFRNEFMELNHREESNIERLPDEHVSIVETTDDKEISRPVGTTRRKLYFNPAYFEPHLMAEPPPAALEFLTKIREVIAIAKNKMEAKRFQPVLNQIPEEDTYQSSSNNIDYYQSSQSESIVSLKRENNRKKSNCIGCPGCKSDDNNEIVNFMKFDTPICSNCINNKGEKQNSIRKWLENIPIEQNTLYNESSPNHKQHSYLSTISEKMCKLKRKDSFSDSCSMYLIDNDTGPKNSSTMTIKSAPLIRNYNLPLPDFDNLHYSHNNGNNFSKTISPVDDVNPIGPNGFKPNDLQNTKLGRSRNHFIANRNTLPDMVSEAIALDHCSKSYTQSSSDEDKLRKKAKFVKSGSVKRITAESPTGNDYETDSLERSSNKKNSLATEYYDLPSSQASPTLSNALPLEEELTMTNAIYKTHSHSESNTPSPQKEIFIEQNQYETIGKNYIEQKSQNTSTNTTSIARDYSLVSEVYVNNNYNFGSTPTSPSGSECSMGARKLNKNADKKIEEASGCLLIEVMDPPENYIKIHESDSFEPDTLDRKHAKYKEMLENTQFSRKDLLKNIDQNKFPANQFINVRSSGTFKKNNDSIDNAAKFNSLRNLYDQKVPHDRTKLSPTLFTQSKEIEQNTNDSWDDTPDWSSEEGRILTLELRHSKRQRQCTTPTVKQYRNLPRPDILPPLPPTHDNPIYEQPTSPPRRVENTKVLLEIHQKNVSGRSLSPRTFTKNMKTDPFSSNKPIFHQTSNVPSHNIIRASVQSQSSDYENKTGNNIPDSTRKLRDSISGKRRRSITNASSGVNTTTFTKIQKENINSRSRFRRKKGFNIEDSGYLSSDSASSRKVPRKLVIAKIVSCSDSDDTENEARSESGAESVETHSVYFGSFRKPQTITVDDDCDDTVKSERDTRRTAKN